MTHVYYHPIRVTLADGKPATIHWRGGAYRVLEVNEPWRLMDRWWEQPSVSSAGGKDHKDHKGRSERTYYRLRCVPLSASTREDLTCDLYCDIYYEALGGVWILERVYD